MGTPEILLLLSLAVLFILFVLVPTVKARRKHKLTLKPMRSTPKVTVHLKSEKETKKK